MKNQRVITPENIPFCLMPIKSTVFLRQRGVIGLAVSLGIPIEADESKLIYNSDYRWRKFRLNEFKGVLPKTTMLLASV